MNIGKKTHTASLRSAAARAVKEMKYVSRVGNVSKVEKNLISMKTQNIKVTIFFFFRVLPKRQFPNTAPTPKSSGLIMKSVNIYFSTDTSRSRACTCDVSLKRAVREFRQDSCDIHCCRCLRMFDVLIVPILHQVSSTPRKSCVVNCLA